jgi:hypothetical protein
LLLQFLLLFELSLTIQLVLPYSLSIPLRLPG